jgi:diguanylate cyclase (GGDEF)-like protein
MPESQPNILIVDDTPANLVAMRKLLKGMDAKLIEANNGNAALAACLDQEFALILLDVNMPDMDGFEVAHYLGDEERTRDTPIIFVTAAYADDMNRLKGYANGAVDYIAKPINDVILQSKVRVFLDLYRSKQILRENVSQLSALNRQLKQEMEERARAEERARHEATHDPLTGVANRVLFMDRLQLALDRGRRSNHPFALLYIDIDGFKAVNDGYGHEVGDQLLRQLSALLRESARTEDVVGRLGGEEFVVICPGANLAVGLRLAERLRQCAAGHAFQAGSLSLRATVSIGVAERAPGMAHPDDMLRAADAALYRAKHNGRNCVQAARFPLETAGRVAN